MKTIYFVKAVNMVSYYDCDCCGQQKPVSEFNPLNLVCSDYVCTECEFDVELERQVNEKGGLA